MNITLLLRQLIQTICRDKEEGSSLHFRVKIKIGFVTMHTIRVNNLNFNASLPSVKLLG